MKVVPTHKQRREQKQDSQHLLPRRHGPLRGVIMSQQQGTALSLAGLRPACRSNAVAFILCMEVVAK